MPRVSVALLGRLGNGAFTGACVSHQSCVWATGDVHGAVLHTPSAFTPNPRVCGMCIPRATLLTWVLLGFPVYPSPAHWPESVDLRRGGGGACSERRLLLSLTFALHPISCASGYMVVRMHLFPIARICRFIWYPPAPPPPFCASNACVQATLRRWFRHFLARRSWRCGL